MSEQNEEITDIAELPAVEILSRYTIELLSVAAIHCGLAENGRPADLDEARKIIDSVAGLITGAAPYLGDQHARPLRAALREIQLAFREAAPFPDAPGAGPGEKFTGPVA